MGHSTGSTAFGVVSPLPIESYCEGLVIHSNPRLGDIVGNYSSWFPARKTISSGNYHQRSRLEIPDKYMTFKEKNIEFNGGFSGKPRFDDHRVYQSMAAKSFY